MNVVYSGKPSVVKGNCKFSVNYGAARHVMRRTRQGNFTADTGYPTWTSCFVSLTMLAKLPSWVIESRGEQHDAPYGAGTKCMPEWRNHLLSQA
jgi:hypothetical protein